MKSEKYDLSEERRILAAMIASKRVLARITSKWLTSKEEDGLFASPWANTLGKLCVGFHRKHQEAPGKGIESLFTAWASKARDESTISLVENFLTSLDYSLESVNEGHVIDSAGVYFSKVRKKKLLEKVEGFLSIGELDKADEAIRNYRKVEMGLYSGSDVLLDEDLIWSALDEKKTEVLVNYPGDLGKFFGYSLSRDNFIAFQGPEKSAKTFALLDVGWRGMLNRKRVAFFEIGDMTQDQILRRFVVRAAKRPIKPKTIKKPILLVNHGDDSYHVEWEEKVYTTPLDFAEARAAFQKVQKNALKSNESYLKLYTAPAGTVSLSMIDEAIETWAQNNWVVDICIVDYADLIRPSMGYGDPREKVNEIWMGLRALSQKYHCLVVTATQANREAYTAKVVKMEHASEDKRKNAHATGIVGISRSSKERDLNLARYNWTVLREDEHNPNRCCTLAQCLGIANPCVKSCF